MNAIEVKQYLPLIVERLRAVNPAKIILFGSYAYGKPTTDSDLDLMVILNQDDLPNSYKEKSELYLQVSRMIRDIRQQIPIDLIVHTQAMYKKFIALGSIFSKEIAKKGIVLYEADNQRVA